MHIVASVLWSFLHASINLVLYWVIASPGRSGATHSLATAAQVMGETFALGVLAYWVVLLAIYGLDSYRRYELERLRNANLQRELAEAELSALKMQLQPHFLFNTLHSLTDLILEDAEAATRMVARLGDFLRHTMDGPRSQTISLEAELEFLQSYLEIEKVRFHDRLEIEMAIEPVTRRAEVPNLILQPLVENAIRYGVAACSGPGRVAIAARERNGRLEVSIRDNGPGWDGTTGAGGRAGVGLRNTRARLHRLYGSEQSIEVLTYPHKTGTEVRMSIPFLSYLARPATSPEDL